MSRIKTNIIYNLGYQILVLIVPLVTSPYISRVLGTEGVGTYSYVSSVAYYFFILVTLGLTNYGNRYIAKNREDKVARSKAFWSIYFMQLMVGICILIAYIIYSRYIAEGPYRTYFLIYTIYIIGACLDVNWFFFGMEDFKLTTIRNTIVKLITVVLIFTLVRNEKALEMYFLIVAGSTLLSNAILWTKIPVSVTFYKPSIKEILIHIKPNFILFLPILAISIYRVMDKIMIKHLSDVIQSGYYENADRIITISMTAFSAVSTVMMPAISNMVANKDNDTVNRMLYDIMQGINGLSIAMMFGLMAISKKFAPLYFGDEFAESGILLIGLAPTIFLSGWKNVIRSQYLIPYEKDKAYMISLVSGAAVNIVVNMICIPVLGARGAVIGTIFAELVGFIIQTYVAAKEISILTIIKQAIVLVPGGLLMGAFVILLLNLLPYSLLSIMLVIIFGGLLYAALSIIALKVFDKKRFEYLHRLLFGMIKK